MNDPNGGGHLICVLGYRTDSHGKRIFKFANSWGASSWGEGGYGEGNEDWLHSSYERYAVRVQKVKS
jgi:C1A family cysteine protease